MMTIGVKLDEAKSMFFDRPKIMNSIGKARRRVLSKFGAYVRTRARTSIRKRKGTSEPGRPPYSHTGLLRQNIYFGYDRTRESVVIGPTLTNQRNAWGYGGYKTIPATIESGGHIRIREHQNRNGEWVRTDMRFRINENNWRSAVNKTTRQRLATIRPRPYMKPAFDAELPKADKLWLNALK